MTPRTIVLDANVLMRAVLGRRVARLLEDFAPQVTFLAPDVAFDEVREHLAAVLTKRGELRALQASLDKLAALQTAVQVVDHAEYEAMKPAALARVGPRDPDDWPVLARTAAELPHLDRGQGFLWHRRRHLDDGPGRAVLHRPKPGVGGTMTRTP